MFNFQVIFTYPWLFLLLIPAVALALVPYFLSAKKYRRNRNRITSIVLFFITMTLSVSVLVGVNFEYDVYNSENEIMLVVDASYSTKEEKEAKDGYVKDIIDMTNSRIFKLGIVTFGFDQQYVLPLTADLSGAYGKYTDAPAPDTSATDIAAALMFADSKFENPESAKIILVSDGIETDESVQSVIRTVAAHGVRVDTIRCSSLKPDSEVLITGATFPDYNIAVGDSITATLEVKSNYKSDIPAKITVTDNDGEGKEFEVELTSGTTAVPFEWVFEEEGLHKFNFRIQAQRDTVAENNELYSYVYLVPHESVLIIENFENESNELYNLLKDEFRPKVVTVGDPEFPTTLAQLREYDEIILNNVASEDLTVEFKTILDEYVQVVGGGLFTVGGSEPGNPDVAHAYNREDMAGSQLQKMLPVDAINYTPPIAVVIVIDVSSSMLVPSSANPDKTKLDLAKQAAESLVQDSECLGIRDYCGVMKLENSYDVAVRITPMTQSADIIQHISEIEGGGGTNFAPALDRASRDLRALYSGGSVQKMHVVVISDGAAADYNDYTKIMQTYRPEDGPKVTYSFIAIEADEDSKKTLETAAEGFGGGKAYTPKGNDVTQDLKKDISLPEVRAVEYGEFKPAIDPDSPYAKVLTQDNMPSLYGFYGTRAKQSASVVLSGEFGVPVYAEWRYGAGTVGSFMCDLKMTEWSAEFMSSESGRAFISAVVKKLFPAGDIKPKKLSVSIREDNYTTQVSIYPTKPLEAGESVSVSVTNLSVENSQVDIIQPSESDKFSRASFVAKTPGIYEIKVTLTTGSGTEELVLYKSFSYSAEYAVLDGNGEELMNFIAASSEGRADVVNTEERFKAFEGFITSLHRSYDPRFLFIIIALVTFLLNVAVRKFKFKWPHELIQAAIEKRKSK